MNQGSIMESMTWIIHECHELASCTNTPGSYTCSFDAGYQGNGFEYTDINECAEELKMCSVNSECTNMDGTYSCSCKTGYAGDGAECLDIDECELEANNDCDEVAKCKNTEDSYTVQPIHVNVQKDTLATVSFAMTSTNVKFSNVKFMLNASIYKLISSHSNRVCL